MGASALLNNNFHNFFGPFLLTHRVDMHEYYKAYFYTFVLYFILTCTDILDGIECIVQKLTIYLVDIRGVECKLIRQELWSVLSMYSAHLLKKVHVF